MLNELKKKEEIEHSLLEEISTNKDHCSCGASWTHPESRSLAEKNQIFESHRAYFRRKPMEIL